MNWIMAAIIFCLALVIDAQAMMNKWVYAELYRTIEIANGWQKIAKTNCDGDIQGWGHNHDPGLQEH